MIFGKTLEQQEEAEQQDAIRKIKGKWSFAYLPKKLYDGSWVWLQHYWSHYPGKRSTVDYKYYYENLRNFAWKPQEGYIRAHCAGLDDEFN